ncbi:ATP-dependent nuclease [Limosilactobacillus caccae]|uniref:ATP-dependent nuclease n=1 Tax=Limosilactobacillus caccae TaxID=1926284 RepID=UPI000970D0FB|nr:AAA family ATPase [Limosilactobacillus caccae]
MDDNRILITKIEIKNFRSIRRAVLDVKNYNTFVGLNDAGKSNLLKALNLFFNDQTDYQEQFNFKLDFSYLFPKKTHNTKEIKIKITFLIPKGYRDSGKITWEKTWRTNGYFKDRIIDSDGQELHARSRVPGALRQIRFRYIPAVKSKEYYKGLLADLYLSVSSSLDSPLKKSISNFSNTLRNYTSEISKNALKHLGITSRLSIPENLSEIFKALEFITSDKDRNLNIDLEKRGDGIQARHIPFILKYIANEDQKSRSKGSTKIVTIWGFEEPENGLELTKAFDMAEEFLDYSNDIQMFITTHSPAFYLNKDSENSKVFYVSKDDNEGETLYLDNYKKAMITRKMGLMPLVAPFIKEAQIKLRKAEAEIRNTPFTDVDSIMVEGMYDQKYLEMAINQYSHNNLYNKIKSKKLKIITKPEEGGCEKIVNLAKAWIYANNKSKLYIIFDRDKAGESANKELNGFVKEFKHEHEKKRGKALPIKNSFWEYTDAMKEANNRNKIHLYVEVEDLLSLTFWDGLLGKNYIEEKSYDTLNCILKGMTSKNESLDALTDKLGNQYPELKYLVKYKPIDQKKKQIFNLAQKIYNESEKDALLKNFEPTVRKLEEYFQ